MHPSQVWCNNVVSHLFSNGRFLIWNDRLDSIGICGFGYDFKSAEGRDSPVNDVFSHLNESTSNDARALIDIISPMFPLIFRIPMRTVRMLRMLNKATSEFAAELIKNSRKEMDCSDDIKDRSMLGELGEEVNCACFFLRLIWCKWEDNPKV